jgi:hypothetical protein
LSGRLARGRRGLVHYQGLANLLAKRNPLDDTAERDFLSIDLNCGRGRGRS